MGGGGGPTSPSRDSRNDRVALPEGSVLLRKAAITSGVRRFRTAAVCRIKRPRPSRVSLLCTVLPMSSTLACKSDVALGGSGRDCGFFGSGVGAASEGELVGASAIASSLAMLVDRTGQ